MTNKLKSLLPEEGNPITEPYDASLHAQQQSSRWMRKYVIGYLNLLLSKAIPSL